MRLSKNFTLKELTFSQTAINHDLDNTPCLAYIRNLEHLTKQVLQPLRDYLDVPIMCSSGYRSAQLNKIIGGSKNSHHLRGCAVVRLILTRLVIHLIL